MFPLTVSHACAATGTPWGHVSSGCIYSGAKIGDGESQRIQPDLTAPAMRELLTTNPAAVHGFTETDEPNFSFRPPPCSFYSGTKALAAEALTDDHQLYLWRPRIPFHQVEYPRHFPVNVQPESQVHAVVNSPPPLDE